MISTENEEALWNKALRYYRVFEEHVLRRVFTEGLHGLIGHSMRSYWSLKKHAAVHKLAVQVTFMTYLQHRSRLSHSSHTHSEPKNRCKNTNDQRSS